MAARRASQIRPGRTIALGGEQFLVTEVDAVEDPALGTLVVIRCGERTFRRPPKTKIEVIK